MREVLFRGKKVDNGEWVYGAYNNVCENTIIDIDDITHMRIDVIPETIGQYTGLTDKSGKKIFEGDIVKVKDNNEVLIGKIEYLFDRFAVVIGMWIGDLKRYATTRNLFFKVIGNIHDNPELLEEKNE